MVLEERITKTTLIMVYWKGKEFWLGKLLQHPEVMTQGTTVEELEENLKNAYRLLILDAVPADARWRTSLSINASRSHATSAPSSCT
jgi:predicted RNase H-like HicB family nuclease